MSTATLAPNGARPANTPRHSSDSGATLDAVISETEKRLNVVKEAAKNLGLSDHRKLFDFLRNLWPQKDHPFTDAELFQAVSMIARYDLDPLVREIYCSRDKRGRIMVIVGIDGWIKILHRTEGYDGHEQTIEFDDKGALFSATTTIYSTLRSHPVKYLALWREYQAVGGFVKDQMPSHMLRVFSLRHAARQFAPIGGNVVTEGEARYMQHVDNGHDSDGVQHDIRSASNRLADMLEGDTSDSNESIDVLQPVTADGSDSNETPNTSALARQDGEDAGAWVSRVNAAVTECQSQDALMAIQTLVDQDKSLETKHRQSVARHVNRKSEELVKAKGNSSLIA